MVQVISIVITCLAGLFGLIGLLVGLGRRTYRSLIRMGTVLLAAVLAALISSPIASAVYGGVGDTFREALTTSFGESFSMLMQSEALGNLLTVLPSVIIAVLLYVPLFIILSLLMLIPYGIICHYVLDKKKKPVKQEETPVEIITEPMPDNKKKKGDFPGDRLVGMAVGAVTGLLICSFIFAPLCGALGVAKNVCDLMPDTGEYASLAEAVDTIGNHWFVKATNLYSGLLLGSVTKANLAGTNVNFSEELALFASLSEELLPLLEDNELTGGELMSALPSILDKVVESDLVCAVAADYLSALSEAWRNGEKYTNLEKPELDASIQPLFDKVTEIFASSTQETIREDLQTLSALVTVLNDHGVYEAFAAAEEGSSEVDFSVLLQDEALIPDLMSTVVDNDRMKALLPSVINLGISALGESLALPESDAALYDTLMQVLADELNMKPSKKDLTAFTKQALRENGATVSDAVAEILAEGLYEEFKKTDNVTAEDVATFMAQIFADMSAEADTPFFILASTANISKIREKLAQLDESDRKGSETLRDKTAFKSDKITVDKIKIDDDALSALSEEELKQEVTLLSSVLQSAAQFIDTMNGTGEETEITLADLDMKALGRAVDGLMTSKLLGDTSENLLGAILESDMVETVIPNAKETLGKTLLDGVKDGTLQFENVFEASQKSAALIDAVRDEALTDEEKAAKIEECVTWLLDNMSADTANAIKSVLSVDLLKTFGLDDKPAQSVSVLVGVLLDELTSASLDKEEYAKEAAAIKELLSVAVNGGPITEKEVYRSLLDSTIITATVKKSVAELGNDPFDVTKDMSKKALTSYKADVKEHLKYVFDDLYISAPDKTSFKESLIALGKLLGVDLTKEINGWTK